MKKKDVVSKKDDDQKPNDEQVPASTEAEEDDIEVTDPGDCIGHWAECKECEMCEIQDSCQAMTKNINGEDDSNAEEK